MNLHDRLNELLSDSCECSQLLGTCRKCNESMFVIENYGTNIRNAIEYLNKFAVARKTYPKYIKRMPNEFQVLFEELDSVLSSLK